MGASGTPRYRSSRARLAPTGTVFLWERCLPANEALWVHQAHRVIVLRGQASLQRAQCFCGSGACPRIRRCGASGTPRYHSSRASLAPTGTVFLWERCLPANQALWCIRHTALSFFAGKPRSNGHSVFVGAVLARESGAGVHQAHRVIILRGQASLQQVAFQTN